MADHLTDEDRRLIREALEAGRLIECAPRQHSEQAGSPREYRKDSPGWRRAVEFEFARARAEGKALSWAQAMRAAAARAEAARAAMRQRMSEEERGAFRRWTGLA